MINIAPTRRSPKYAEWCSEIYNLVKDSPFLTEEIESLSVQRMGVLNKNNHVVRIREDRETPFGYVKSIYKLSPSGIKLAGWWNS